MKKSSSNQVSSLVLWAFKKKKTIHLVYQVLRQNTDATEEREERRGEGKGGEGKGEEGGQPHSQKERKRQTNKQTNEECRGFWLGNRAENTNHVWSTFCAPNTYFILFLKFHTYKTLLLSFYRYINPEARWLTPSHIASKSIRFKVLSFPRNRSITMPS